MTARYSPGLVRFHDLDAERLNVEFQVHTTQTDGHGTIDEVLEAARDRGVGALAFTEHVRLDTPWFPDFARRVREAARRFPGVRVLVGCEAKALDTAGTLDVADEVRAECDLVLGSVHRFPDGAGGYLRFEDFSPAALADAECALAVGLLRHAPIDVLAHPGGMYQRRHGRYPDDLYREMMAASLERGVAIEINASYLADFDAFLRLCDEMNPWVSIGSDVHRLDEMGRCRDALLATGRWAP